MAAFDRVHDVQLAFRGLLRAFTFPGTLVDLAATAERLGSLLPPTPAPAGLLLAAATLIDNETTYWSDQAEVTRFLTEWSASAPSPASASAFLVVATFDDARLAGVLERARTGTLIDPHLGATVLVGVDELDTGSPVTLTGPGLEHPLTCHLPSGERWLAARNARVSEFPPESHLAFFDARGRVLALPRTKQPRGGT